MQTYHVVTSGQPERFSVTYHRPEGAMAPQTEGEMRYVPGSGFEVTMRCYEKMPKATYFQPDDPVFRDSCMEAFVNFFPELEGYGYLNIEVNANGAARCRFGVGRQDRPWLREMGLPHPEITVTKTADFWQIHYVIQETLLEKLYKRPCAFAPGHEMRGNFYKCGEETDAPHWASWAELERLDFHAPECFGVLKIV